MDILAPGNSGLVFLMGLETGGPSRPVLQALLFHETGPDLHSFLPRRARDHAFVPGLNVGETHKLVLWLAEDDVVYAIIPGYERPVGVRDLVADKPLSVLKPALQNAEYALQLVVVSLYGGWNFLWVQDVEPNVVSNVSLCAADHSRNTHHADTP